MKVSGQLRAQAVLPSDIELPEQILRIILKWVIKK
jgi:hypothetical protein